MTMAEIEVLLFDIGGVLLTNGWDREARALAVEKFALEPEFHEIHDALAVDLECGRLSLDAYLDQAVFNRPRPFSRDEFRAFIYARSAPHPDVIAVVDELARSRRYLIAALNNESVELNQYRIDRFELRRYFRIFLSSCYLGVSKPHGAMFQTALHVLQRPPSACVFVDDHVANVEAARRAGIISLHYREPSQLRAWLTECGIEATKEMSCD
jgi:putative hydrolase of the HAD superfamily